MSPISFQKLASSVSSESNHLIQALKVNFNDSTAKADLQSLQTQLQRIVSDIQVAYSTGMLPPAANSFVQATDSAGSSFLNSLTQTTNKISTLVKDVLSNTPIPTLAEYDFDLAAGLNKRFLAIEDRVIKQYNKYITPVWASGLFPNATYNASAYGGSYTSPVPASTEAFNYIKNRFDDWLFEQIVLNQVEIETYIPSINSNALTSAQKAALQSFLISFEIDFNNTFSDLSTAQKNRLYTALDQMVRAVFGLE